MLTGIELHHVKCFEAVMLPLQACTVLTGRNASGKSTILQTLVLLQQNALEAEWRGALMLNGTVLKLGTVADFIDKVSGHRSCQIGLHAGDVSCTWAFASDDRRALNLRLSSVTWSSNHEPRHTHRPTDDRNEPLQYLIPPAWLGDSAELRALAHGVRDLHYISAERLGPRESYPLTDPSQRSVGAYGSNAPALLHWFGHEEIAESLMLPDATRVLRDQVQAWMRTFFPGCGFDVQRIPNANLVSLGLRTSEGADFHRPQHVGFGLTHLFPIVTAALIARPGQLLLIENPESHLHPAGQSRVGQLLARVAAAGVQVILETHSDHVINGLRRAVRQSHIAPDDVAMYFFNDRTVPDRSQVVALQLDRDGKLDHWPEGFFDQLDKDTAFLAGWGE